jgi:membrane-associated protein
MLELLSALFLHLDTTLLSFTTQLGPWIYLILFMVIFAETGLVVTPFLPGDSLLFAAGALCATGHLNLSLILGPLIIAAILGDAVNYAVGKSLGQKLMQRYPQIFKEVYLKKTEMFYEKYGKKTIVLARFVPIVRTFAPFLAGVGRMSYKTFGLYNILGGFFWIGSCTLAGYFFGSLPFIKKNFSAVVLGIILVSILPLLYEFVKSHRAKRLS